MSKPTNTFFTAKDIINRFSYDLKSFKEKQSQNKKVEIISIKELDGLSSSLTKHETLDPTLNDGVYKNRIANISDIIKQMGVDNTSNYIAKTHSSNLDELPNLWVLRTYLFECILLMTTLIVRDTNIFDEYKKQCVDSDIPDDLIGGWMDGVNGEHFKLGIFGSMDATSDIDLSIQYCNTNTENPDAFVAGLMYINRIIENLFIAYTGFTSLDFDIECYGTIIFQYDEKLEQGKDVYYLNCNKLDKNHYDKLLVYAFASIYRNYIMSKPQGQINKQFFIEPILNLKRILTKNKEYPMDLITYLEVPKTFNVRNSIDMVDDYVNPKDSTNNPITEKMAVYNAKRRLYYKKLYEADKNRKDTYIKVQNSINKNAAINLEPDEIMGVIIGEASFSLCREESYLLAPTIMHVVRTLQIFSSQCETENRENKTNKEAKNACVLKYQTNFPICVNDSVHNAYCNIGKYGYFLSILEQIGYMWRFYNQYCLPTSQPKNDESCKKKLTKYGDRFKNGILLVGELDNLKINGKLDNSKGGLRQTRKKTQPRKKTQTRKKKQPRKKTQKRKRKH